MSGSRPGNSAFSRIHSRGGEADWQAVHRICGEAWPAAQSSPLRQAAAAKPRFESDLDVRGLEAVLAEFLPWALETFPLSTPASCIEHLRREVEELLADPTDHLEIADCIFLLADACQRAGIDLVAALIEKLAIVRARKRGEPDAQGVVEHVRSPLPAEGEGSPEEAPDQGETGA